MKLYFIRHGKTEGNKERKFHGCGTDEPLSQEGRDALKAIEGMPEDAFIVSSPMKRARETAAIFFPEAEPLIIDDLREMDFGIFEGKNHAMLDGDPAYQAWLDSGGEANIPEGETITEFGRRIMRGLREAVRAAASGGADTMCIVAHGGTIMAAMSGLTGGEYLSFNAPNGAGYIIELETDDAGNVTAATTYDRFCGGLRAGSDAWRPPQYTPSDSFDR